MYVCVRGVRVSVYAREKERERENVNDINTKGKVFFECSSSRSFRARSLIIVAYVLRFSFCLCPFTFLPSPDIQSVLHNLPFIIMTESVEFRDDFSSISKKKNRLLLF